MQNTPDCGKDGAEVRIATASEPNNFSSHAVLLSGKFKGHKVGGEQLIGGRCGGVEDHRAQKQADVAQVERLRVTDGPGVFAGPQEKVEGKA